MYLESSISLKSLLCTSIGCAGSMIACALGGFDLGLKILILLMATDYLTGLMVAGVFHTSEKTPSGGLESRAGWKGLCRKGVVLLMVLVAHCVDMTAGCHLIRDAVVIGYSLNEMISITENAGLMGVPVPKPLLQAIDVLQRKEDSSHGNV